MNLRKKRIMLICNIIYIILAIILIHFYIMFNNNFVTSSTGKTYVDTWDTIKLTSELKENLKTYIFTDIFSYENVSIKNTVMVKVAVVERHGRATGTLELEGKYDDYATIEKLFDELNMTTDDKIGGIYSYYPRENNMRNIVGSVNKNKKTFQIDLYQDLLLDFAGQDMRLYNDTLHQLFKNTSDKKLKKINYQFLIILFFSILFLIMIDIAIYYENAPDN